MAQTSRVSRGGMVHKNCWFMSSIGFGVVLASTVFLAGPRQAKAADLTWKGLDWNITNGGMAGVAQGSPDNVSVDANGYLHLKIVKNGSTWTAAELFTTTHLG